MSKIGYVRVSQMEQTLDHQEAIMKEYGVDRIISEHAAGFSLNRPQFKAMLAELHEGDTLYVVSIDRIGCNTKELTDLVDTLFQKKVTLVIHEPKCECRTAADSIILKWNIICSNRKRAK